MAMGYITRKRAYHMLKTGRNLKKLFQLIKPHVLAKDPDALYIYSCFSLDEWNEDEKTFLERRIKYLHFAAKYGVLEALHEVGLYYHTGQGIEQDKNKAAGLFKAAAERGHSYSKLYYGLDLFYGSCGIEKDEDLGILYVREAVDDGVEDAYKSLKKITMLKGMTAEERAAYFEEEKQKATTKKKKKVSRVKLTVDPSIEEDKEIADILDQKPASDISGEYDAGEDDAGEDVVGEDDTGEDDTGDDKDLVEDEGEEEKLEKEKEKEYEDVFSETDENLDDFFDSSKYAQEDRQSGGNVAGDSGLVSDDVGVDASPEDIAAGPKTVSKTPDIFTRKPAAVVPEESPPAVIEDEEKAAASEDKEKLEEIKKPEELHEPEGEKIPDDRSEEDQKILVHEVYEIKPRGGVIEEEDDGFFDDLDIDLPAKQKESEDI